MVETQLRNLRATSDTFVGRAYSIISHMVFVNQNYNVINNTQFHKKKITGDRSSVFYVLSL